MLVSPCCHPFRVQDAQQLAWIITDTMDNIIKEKGMRELEDVLQPSVDEIPNHDKQNTHDA